MGYWSLYIMRGRGNHTDASCSFGRRTVYCFSYSVGTIVRNQWYGTTKERVHLACCFIFITCNFWVYSVCWEWRIS